jgi:glycosyltransferase involved in cell wall biosynthesis
MTKPVSVLYEIHPHILGGTERFLARFFERLDRERYEPVVISPKNGKPLHLVRSAGVRAEVMEDYFRLIGIRRLAAFIRRNNIGLAQSNYYSSHLAMASSIAGVPHIWRLGGHLDFGGVARTRRDTRSALEIIRLLSSAIICNSNYVRSQFRGQGLGAPRIQVIPNGISVPTVAPQKKWGGDFRVGMVAHFALQKRHTDFIHAAEIVCESRDDVSFAILGSRYADSASRAYAAQVQRRAGSLQRKGKLSISEYVNSGDGVPGGLDIVVLPSVCESFSNSILEAMALGIPVIAARSGGNSELVEHRKTGLLIPPMRPEAIAQAILLMVKEPKLIGRMGRAARQRVKTHFRMDECVRSYEAVYSRVISDSE